SLGIPLSTLEEHGNVDLTVDGADEVDPSFNLIKGLGGALVREKILASASRGMVVIVDSSKMTDRLGSRSPVPVEVIPYGVAPCRRKLEEMGASVALRLAGSAPFVTDNGNQVLDARFEQILDPAALESQINDIPGVVGNGLFIGMADTVIVGTEEGATVKRKGDRG
ncbi:MAG: ribose-5-phosphate isomerase RpiA, partial [Planctomycetota bacterium]|nr:ribose-5-phosphate isomerase RpiA [Planctomycetota bacterium]